MAFLDNSGDIILDAVLTDTGRFRLAKGDGTFRIVKFALGDDEINYAEYDKNNISGSAYYDLQILQTPILEAFTNNTSLMKSKLISIPRTNLLYLPVIRLSGNSTGGGSNSLPVGQTFGNNAYYIVCVDEKTVGKRGSQDGLLIMDTATADEATVAGRLNGFAAVEGDGNFIRTDQGLDTTEISKDYTIDADLNETQYIIEIDNRFGSITAPPAPAGGNNSIRASVSFIDDDNIASYYLSAGTDASFIQNIDGNTTDTTIEGPRGTSLSFRIQASTELATSNYLFTQLGSTTTLTEADGTSGPMSVYFIDTIVKVTGATTGYRIDIPVRFVRNSA